MKVENFSFQNINVRAIVMDGEPWFVANDVCECLKYAAPRNAIPAHTSPDDRKPLNYGDCTDSVRSELWKGNDRKDKTLINESGLYCLIFGSKTKAATEFKLWVTREVLRSIRKNGGYIDGQEYLPKEKYEKLIKGLVKLSRQVKELMASNAKYKQRWHELIQEKEDLKEDKRKLKEKIREQKMETARMSRKWHEAIYERKLLSEELVKAKTKFKKETKLLKEDADDAYTIIEKMHEDMKTLRARLSDATNQIVHLTTPSKGISYTVDKYGYVQNIVA